MSDDAPTCPPHDLRAEMACLGAMLLNPDALEMGCDQLVADDFYVLRHQTIWQALKDLRDNEGAVDLVMLRAQLRGMGKLEEVGGWQALTACMESVPLSHHIGGYLGVVNRQSALRKLLQLKAVAQRAGEGREDVAALVSEIRKHLEQIEPAAAEVPHVGQWLDEAAAWARDARMGERKLVRTGIWNFDKRYGGFEPGELVVIMAFSSVGKTALLSNILLHAALVDGLPCLMFSAEVAGRTLVIDWLRIEAQVDWWDVKAGNMLSKQADLWREHMHTIRQAPLYVDATPRIHVEDILTRSRVACRQHAIKLIAVDFLQLLRTRACREKYNLQVAHISAELKRLAREANVPVIVLSQETLTDSGRRRTRWAEETEQVADWVLCLERTEHTNTPEDEDDVVERKLCVTKSRHRATGYTRLTFDKPRLTFRGTE